MNYIHTIRVGEQEYAIAPAIDDASADPEKTWSAQKLTQTIGDISGALTRIIATQQSYIDGGAVQ